MCTETEPLEDILFHRGRRMRPKANKSAAPGEGLRGVWVCRDVENKARIVVDGMVKDVDTGGGWGTRGVLFLPLINARI